MNSGPETYSATIVVVTKNRKEELREALRSATQQSGSVEVLVVDDGSTDGTSEMVTREFPAVRLIRAPESRGYIRQRNFGAEQARSPVIVSIDDDAEFTSTDAVAITLAEFDHPRIAAVAMPFIQERRGDEVLQRAPSDEGTWVTNIYIGTAHAVRRDVFLALGGYDEDLEHLMEEADYCLRLQRAGFVIRLGTAPPILHHESTSRNVVRDATYLSRNHALLAWLHLPFPYVLFRGIQVLGLVGWMSVRWRAPRSALQGSASAIRYAVRNRGRRAPMTRSAYRLVRNLRRHPMRLSEVEGSLPPLPAGRTMP